MKVSSNRELPTIRLKGRFLAWVLPQGDGKFYIQTVCHSFDHSRPVVNYEGDLLSEDAALIRAKWLLWNNGTITAQDLNELDISRIAPITSEGQDYKNSTIVEVESSAA